MATILSICEQGYRATVEEQDDTVIWLTHMLRRSEMDIGLVLRGSAVNYASTSPEPVGVSFGDWTQAHPANLARDLESFIADGGRVYASSEDLAKYALERSKLVEGVIPLDFDGIVDLIGDHDIIMNW